MDSFSHNLANSEDWEVSNDTNWLEEDSDDPDYYPDDWQEYSGSDAMKFDDIYLNSTGNRIEQSVQKQSKEKSTCKKELSIQRSQTGPSYRSESERSHLKVELKSVAIPNAIKNDILNTLRINYGENFAFNNSEISESKRRLSDHYWMNRGHLIVRNCYDYSTRKQEIDKEKVNSLLLERLEKYGFFTNHCCEALLQTDNDFETAVVLLTGIYFDLVFNVNAGSNNLPELDDELVALQSIYENIVEEKVKHKHWIFNLQLDYLADWYRQEKNGFAGEIKRPIKSVQKPICWNYSRNKTCRFGASCRFVHEERFQEHCSNSFVNDEKLKSLFKLDIYFPDDCNYPLGVPIILFSALHKEFPPYTCLRISKLLAKEAVMLAANGYPYCYNLIDLLQNSSEIIINWLKDDSASRMHVDPVMSIFKVDPPSETNVDEHHHTINKFTSDLRRGPASENRILAHRDEEIISRFRSRVCSAGFRKIANERRHLPAWNVQDEILDILNHNQVVVVVGDTGCGKTTQIPQFILDGWLMPAAGLSDKQPICDRVEIVCTQPRRISAIAVATRVAQERAERVGETVGYQIRLESCSSPYTRLLFCTTGILLKKLESDSSLKSVTHVIIDEVHERSEESDFLLLILKDLLKIRPDLKVLLMSATLNAESFSSYFDGAPLMEIPGKMYPVAELHLEDVLEEIDYVIEEGSKGSRNLNKTKSRHLDELEHDLILADTLNRATQSSLSTSDECLTAQQLFFRYKDYSMRTRKSIFLLDPERIDPELVVSVLTWIVDGNHNFPRDGSILVFLPGLSDIMAVHDEISCHNLLSPKTGRFVVIPLHSTISNEEQSAVFRKTHGGARKIVLATNIAETSVTIDDCVFVIDSGKMKENRFDSNKNMSSLETMWISKANAKQRRGRAGRLRPGVCIRLYTYFRHEYNFDSLPVPEIKRVALDQVILRTKTLDYFKGKLIEDVLEQILEPPTRNSIETSIVRLKNLGALDDNQELTALGRHLSSLPVDVKIGKLILFGAIFCCLDPILTIAASLSNKSPFLSPFSRREEAEKRKRAFSMYNSDHLTVLNAYKQWHSTASHKWHLRKRFAEENFLSWKTLEMMGDLKHQYLELLVSIGFVVVNAHVRRYHHEDKVSQMLPRELNANENNCSLLSSIICAALYPNLAKILTPDKTYSMGISGAIPKDYEASELKFKTNCDGYVCIHPSSVNARVSDFKSPYLVFQEKIKTTKVFIRDCTMVSAVALMLLSGCDLKIEQSSGLYLVSLESGWLVFTLRSLEDARMLQHMKLEINKLLQKKIENPNLNLFSNDFDKRIISNIVDLVSHCL